MAKAGRGQDAGCRDPLGGRGAVSPLLINGKAQETAPLGGKGVSQSPGQVSESNTDALAARQLYLDHRANSKRAR